MLFLVMIETLLQFFRFFRIVLYILKVVSVTTLQPRKRIASVLPQDKKLLGTALAELHSQIKVAFDISETKLSQKN
jgi:hypothetical protein